MLVDDQDSLTEGKVEWAVWKRWEGREGRGEETGS